MSAIDMLAFVLWGLLCCASISSLLLFSHKEVEDAPPSELQDVRLKNELMFTRELKREKEVSV